MRFLLVCCFLFVGETGILADDSNSAKSFREKCNALFSNEDLFTYSHGSSAGYCFGTVGTVMALGPFLAPGFKFCPPDTRPISGIGALSRYLKAHPDRLNDEELSVLIQAYDEEWPCK